jgi:hypothetical protein
VVEEAGEDFERDGVLQVAGREAARLKDNVIGLAKNALTNRRLKQRHWLFIGGVP